MKNETQEIDKDLILIAIGSLKKTVSVSNLESNDKNTLILLLERIGVYYKKRINSLSKGGRYSQEKIMILQSFITDILVEVNNVLLGEIDIRYFASIINTRLNNNDEIKRIERRKKVI